MAKKSVWLDTDMTWDGTETTEKKFGKTITVTSADQVWSETASLWSDDVISILARITVGGSRGGVRTKQDTWNAWNKVNQADRKKVTKVILTLQGREYVSEAVLDEYKVTVEDVELIVVEFEKYMVSVTDVNILDEGQIAERERAAKEKIRIEEAEKKRIQDEREKMTVAELAEKLENVERELREIKGDK